MQLETPTYDRSQIRPGIAHFGVGNFHRSHQAMYVDALLAGGDHNDWGICGIGVMPGDRAMRDALQSQDYLYTLVEKAGDCSMSARQIGSICGFFFAPESPEAVIDLVIAPTTRIVSLTITEGGYNIDPASGAFNLRHPGVQHDLEHPHAPATVFGFITEALSIRASQGISPFTVMSCDNLPGNGHVARQAITTYARERDPELGDWIDANVAFPNSMVDRITPVTTDADREVVSREFGITDAWPVMTEPFRQWVLEDTFCNGRPSWERVGVQLVHDVEPYELMKLRLLNASHQAMAYYGMLLGHTYVHEAVSDPRIVTFLRAWFDEAVPTLPPLPGIDVEAYVATLLDRYSNVAIADTLARLAVDASDRIPKFVLPVVRDNLAAGHSVRVGAAIVASWAAWLRHMSSTGGVESVQDPLRSTFLDLATREDPRDFVAVTEIFGDLSHQQPFVDEVRDITHRIRTDGVASLHMVVAS